MTGLRITQAERNLWQRRAAVELVRILQEHRDLPVIAWTVGTAGSVLVGHVNGLRPAAMARASFDAWTVALAVTQRREYSDLALTCLTAKVRRDNVDIVIRVDLLLDEDGERP